MRQKDYNKRKTGNRDMYNAEGYKDMTAYLALRNIERDERAKRHEKRTRRTSPGAPVLSDYERMGKEDEQYFHEEMANAIIIRAVKDWREAVQILKEYPGDPDALSTIRETEKFFLSAYYATLTTYDGETLLQRLKEEAGYDL